MRLKVESAACVDEDRRIAGASPSTGATAVFERIDVPAGTVIGATLDVKGIGLRGGFGAASDGLGTLVCAE
jgi:hypothetical protein